jgi:aspartate carbamoyltransferase catalytic subunit
MFNRKDFIGLADLSKEEILNILQTAETMKYVLSQNNKKVPYLDGKSVIMLFYEKSVRAKLSYELAAQYLSANIVEITVTDGDERHSNINDMGRTIDQMGGDFIICRHPMSGSAKFLSERVKASVVNAGDGINEDPSQALLDLMTIKDVKGHFEGLNVLIVGDVAGSRVARSNIWGLTTLGANVWVAGPPTLIPNDLERFGVKVFYNMREALQGADVIISLRLQKEDKYGSKLPSFNEYRNGFKLDASAMKYAKEDAIIMHPGSPDTKVEISSDIVNSKSCILDDQITNGVAIRMALLYLLSMGRGV